MTLQKKPVLLIDASGFIFRAFFAIRALSNSKGLPTNAIYGVATMLDKTIRDQNPEHIAVCFDTPAKTFRHERYPEYKAQRPEPPPALVPQFPLIHQLVRLRGLPLLAIEGVEADDVIGTLARQAEAAGHAVIIVSGDKDLMQLVTDRVKIYDPMKDKWFGPTEVEERFGVTPDRVIEVLGLAGDASDNIPGVPGVGEKTAIKLVKQYDDVAGVLAHASEIKGKLGEQLRENKNLAQLSRELVTIKTDVPLQFSIESLTPGEPDVDGLRKLYAELEFTTLLNSLAPAATIDRSRYRTILRDRELLDLVERLRAAKKFAFDTETTSLDPLLAKLVGLSFCFSENEAYYIPVGHRYLGAPEQISAARACAILRPVLEDPQLLKWAQNGKYDLLVLEQQGIRVRGLAGDTMVADYLLAPERNSHSLDSLAAHYLGHTTIKYEAVTGKGKDQKGFDEVDIKSATQYAAEDAHVTWLVAQIVEEKLRQDEAGWSLYRDLEMPLVEVLAGMERTGVLIDPPFFSTLSDEMEHQIDKLVAQIYELAGESFNLNSTQQIAHILFGKLGIQPGKKTKTGHSTDAGVLERLADEGHAVPKLLLEYRTLAKLKNTYVDALPKLINPQTGRLHTSYNQTVTATGRLSSSDPNLQNIPIRSPYGRLIRKGFIAPAGRLLMSADYSQIELRLAAHLSGDPHMIQTFLSGLDVHTRTAAELLGVFPNLVTPEMRAIAKTVNFGVLYGMTAFRLGRDLGIGTKKAQEFIDQYFSRFPLLKQYLNGIIEQALKTGYVNTILGRRRPIPELKSLDPVQRAGAERAAINTPLQGSAADLIKLAMLNVQRRIEKDRLPITMTMQVHDELVFEVDDRVAAEAAQIIRQEMESVMKLTVPLVVEVNTGKNWMEAH